MKRLLQYEFKNSELLNIALTHSSFAHESKDKNIENNERLEFLGDAVLELTISSFIYKKFPELPEGELTKLRASVVCESALAAKARALKIGENLKLGRGEEITGGRERDSLLADTLEAIIGAVYLDGGIENAEAFILRIMSDIILDSRKTFFYNDFKTHLQEIIQKTSKNTIEYRVVSEVGPAHNKLFKVEALHNGRVLGKGQGKNKKEAEQNAAEKSIEFLMKTENSAAKLEKSKAL